MPAKILILTGAKGGSEFVVREEVLRIGSGESCQIQIPDLVAHAITIRFDRGAYTIYNRSGGLIDLEGDEISESGSSLWQDGQDLQLNRDTILQLRISGNPAPVASAQTEGPGRLRIPADADAEEEQPTTELETDDDDEIATKTPEELQAAKLRNQLIILGALGIAFAVLMAVDSLRPARSSTTSIDVDADFESLVTGITDSIGKNNSTPTISGRFLEDLRKNLQDGRILELRGNDEKAVEKYQYVRRAILSQRTSKPGMEFISDSSDSDGENSGPKDLLKEADSFVLQRLQSCSRGIGASASGQKQ